MNEVNGRRLTSSFIGAKITGAFLMLVSFLLFFLNIIEFNWAYFGMALFLFFIGFMIWWVVKRRNIVYYDNEVFVIKNWKVEEVDKVPNDHISSMLFAGIGLSFYAAEYRLFYMNAKGEKKEFWIFPNAGTNTYTIKERLKKSNPDLLTTNFSMGGIEHLFVKDEDWFR